MSFTEQQLYDALGVGAKEPESAEPAKAAQEPTEEGAREPETAEPAEEGTEAQEPTGAKAEPEETTPAGQQTEEQRREMAAQRRREEQKAAIDTALHRLQMLRELAFAELRDRGSLYRTCGIAAGLLVILVLV